MYEKGLNAIRMAGGDRKEAQTLYFGTVWGRKKCITLRSMGFERLSL